MDNQMLDNGPYLCIRWTRTGDRDFEAEYSLNVPLRDGDARNEAKTGWQKTVIGTTTRNGSEPNKYGYVETPFRDGSHMLWDSGQLRLTGYAVYEDQITAVCANGMWLDGYERDAR